MCIQSFLLTEWIKLQSVQMAIKVPVKKELNLSGLEYATHLEISFQLEIRNIHYKIIVIKKNEFVQLKIHKSSMFDFINKCYCKLKEQFRLVTNLIS